MGRAQEQALNELHGFLDNEIDNQGYLPGTNSSNEPEELRNISSFINDIFRLSPLPMADTFNPMLQTHQLVYESDNGSGWSDDIYSPTSPLDILQHNEISDSSSENNPRHRQQPDIPRNTVLDLPVSASMFMGKRRRDAPCVKSQSLESFFRFGGDEFQARFKRQKKRMEDWDAKGGFNITCGVKGSQVRSKAITDMDMATAFGVVPEDSITTSKNSKRAAAVSPSQPISC